MSRHPGRRTRELPPPLPPERRNVGQLVAESLRAYGRHPLTAVAIGGLVVLVNLLAFWLTAGTQLVVAAVVAGALGGLLVTPAFLLAIGAVTGTPVRRRSALTAYALGALVFLPFPLLVTVFVLPGLAWLALVGLSVPAALVEERPLTDALRRGLALARADYVHVLGGLAALAIVVFVSQGAVYVALRAYAENAAAVAAALAALVASPVLFLGSALLYVDQEARLRSRAEGTERKE